MLAGIAPGHTQGQPHHLQDFQRAGWGKYIGPSLPLKLTVNLSEVDTLLGFQLTSRKKNTRGWEVTIKITLETVENDWCHRENPHSIDDRVPHILRL